MCYSDPQFKSLRKSNSFYFWKFKEFFISFLLFFKFQRKSDITSESVSLIKEHEILQIFNIETKKTDSNLLNANFVSMNLFPKDLTPCL